MHIGNGELFLIQNEIALEDLKERFGDAFQLVPEEHEKEALLELGDKEYVKVDMSKNTPLVNWAKKKNVQKI